MPKKQSHSLKIRKDSQGHYFQSGSKGKHYYYNPESAASTQAAFNKAKKQAAAAYASGYRP